MSTKTNVRSPFFLNLTAPVQTLGTFTCTTAGLTNFSVASSGLVTNPQLLVGTIVGQTATEFALNTSGSTISRSVTYTISIPTGYSNINDATIDCPQTFLQPTQASNENPSVNNNCPTFAGTIPNSTGSASTTVALASYFTSGSSANISSYEIIKSPSNAAVDAVLTGTAPSQTLTISSSIDCASASFIVKAKQSSDACTAISNNFTFASPNCGAYDCTDANVTGGNIEQDGTVNKGIIAIGTLNAVRYDGSDITSSLNAGANNTGSAVNKTITYRINIPSGYSNSGTLDCNVVYSQPATAVLPTFDCAEAQITTPFISEQGSIQNPTNKVGVGTYVSHTPAGFAEVSTNTVRTITFTIAPPSSGYSNSGGSNITCNVNVTQPATFTNCFGTTFFISKESFIRPEDSCQAGMVWSTTVGVSSDINNFNTIISSIGNTVCFRLSPFRGGEKYYAVNSVTANSIAGTNSNYYLIKINDYGVVQEVVQWNCSGGGSGSGDRIV